MSTPIDRIEEGLAEAKHVGAYPNGYYGFVNIHDIEQLVTDTKDLLEAAAHLCGQEPDGTWIVYEDIHGDSVREHLLPVVQRISR